MLTFLICIIYTILLVILGIILAYWIKYESKVSIGFILVPLFFSIVYIGIGMLFLNSKLLSEKHKNTVRKFLFLISPEYGWGYKSSGKKESKFLLIICILMSLIGIALFLLKILLKQ